MPDPSRQRGRVDRWTWHMQRGEFERAWQVSDRVLRARAGTPCWHLPRHLQYIWDGSPLEDRRVLVRCYHGIGDTLQFARYLPRLCDTAAHVMVWAQRAVLPLLRTIDPRPELLPLHDGVVAADYDVDVEIMELPYVFRTTLDSVPARVPYVHADRAVLPARDGLAVGIVWRAGAWAEHRSVPFRLLSPLVSLPVSWYVLQGSPGLAERPAGFGTVAGATDIVEAARVMRALNLVISVDSMAAHLAGALAVPIWTLLSVPADWRWMLDRDDTPWYPTMRLFRQARKGEWEPVIARVAAALRRRVAGEARLQPHL